VFYFNKTYKQSWSVSIFFIMAVVSIFEKQSCVVYIFKMLII